MIDLPLSPLARPCPETTPEELVAWRARLIAAGCMWVREPAPAGHPAPDEGQLLLVVPEGWLTPERLDWAERHEGDLLVIARSVLA